MAKNETSNDALQNVKSILENPAVKYQTLQSTGPNELAKHTLIKHLGWNLKALLSCLRPFDIELCFTTVGRIWNVMWK